jgi:hypothetical protein
MAERRNIKVSADVYERLVARKGSKDTWDAFLNRLVSSVNQEQAHIDRSTLRDFGNSPAGDLELRASSEGSIALNFVDDTRTSVGTVGLNSLDPNQTVTVTLSAGEQATE